MQKNSRRQVTAALPLMGRRGEGETSPPGLLKHQQQRDDRSVPNLGGQ